MKGKLTATNTLSGKLTSVNVLKGKLDVESKLTGELSFIHSLTGALSTEIPTVVTKLELPDIVYVETEEYKGDYEVTPQPFNSQILSTAGRKMNQDVTIFKIPYYKTSNISGYTVYIGGE